MSVYIYKLSQWIEKKFNAKGGNVITDMELAARTVVPLPIGVEERYLQGWNRFSINVVQVAVAAQNSRVRFRNPVGSNVIAVIEMLTVFSVTGADQPVVTWGATTTDLLTIVSLAFTRIDPRGNPTPTMIVSQNAQAAGGTPLIQKAFAGVNTTVDYLVGPDQQLTNLPGQAIDIQSNVVNSQISVNLMWRERALELSELT